MARVVTGTLSDAALEYKTSRQSGIPRPFFFVVASLLAIGAHATLYMASDETTFVLSVGLAGISFGMVWPLMVLVIGEVFGQQHIGKNYMFFDGFTWAVGTLLLSKVVAQYFYESNIDDAEIDDNGEPDRYTCIGQACFGMTHVIIAVLSCTCVVASLGVLYMTKQSYSTARRNPSSELSETTPKLHR